MYCSFNWGGENEINILSLHLQAEHQMLLRADNLCAFQMEIAVVSLQGTYVLVYGEGNPNFKGRVSTNHMMATMKTPMQVYVLYTGTHYDPLVGVNDGEEAETEKQASLDNRNVHHAMFDLTVRCVFSLSGMRWPKRWH